MTDRDASRPIDSRMDAGKGEGSIHVTCMTFLHLKCLPVLMQNQLKQKQKPEFHLLKTLCYNLTISAQHCVGPRTVHVYKAWPEEC